MQTQHQQHTRVFVFRKDEVQLVQHESGQLKPQTSLSTETDLNPASVNSCHQVKSFNLVHVVSIHNLRMIVGKLLSHLQTVPEDLAHFTQTLP